MEGVGPPYTSASASGMGTNGTASAGATPTPASGSGAPRIKLKLKAAPSAAALSAGTPGPTNSAGGADGAPAGDSVTAGGAGGQLGKVHIRAPSPQRPNAGAAVPHASTGRGGRGGGMQAFPMAGHAPPTAPSHAHSAQHAWSQPQQLLPTAAPFNTRGGAAMHQAPASGLPKPPATVKLKIKQDGGSAARAPLPPGVGGSVRAGDAQRAGLPSQQPPLSNSQLGFVIPQGAAAAPAPTSASGRPLKPSSKAASQHQQGVGGARGQGAGKAAKKAAAGGAAAWAGSNAGGTALQGHYPGSGPIPYPGGQPGSAHYQSQTYPSSYPQPPIPGPVHPPPARAHARPPPPTSLGRIVADPDATYPASMVRRKPKQPGAGNKKSGHQPQVHNAQWGAVGGAPLYGQQPHYGGPGAGGIPPPSNLRIPSAAEMDAAGGQRYGLQQPALSPSKRQRGPPGITAPGLLGPGSRATGGGLAHHQAGQVVHSSQAGDGLASAAQLQPGGQQQRQPGQRAGARTAAQRHAAKLQAAIESQRAAVAGVMRARMAMTRGWHPGRGVIAFGTYPKAIRGMPLVLIKLKYIRKPWRTTVPSSVPTTKPDPAGPSTTGAGVKPEANDLVDPSPAPQPQPPDLQAPLQQQQQQEAPANSAQMGPFQGSVPAQNGQAGLKAELPADQQQIAVAEGQPPEGAPQQQPPSMKQQPGAPLSSSPVDQTGPDQAMPSGSALQTPAPGPDQVPERVTLAGLEAELAELGSESDSLECDPETAALIDAALADCLIDWPPGGKAAGAAGNAGVKSEGLQSQFAAATASAGVPARRTPVASPAVSEQGVQLQQRQPAQPPQQQQQPVESGAGPSGAAAIARATIAGNRAVGGASTAGVPAQPQLGVQQQPGLPGSSGTKVRLGIKRVRPANEEGSAAAAAGGSSGTGGGVGGVPSSAQQLPDRVRAAATSQRHQPAGVPAAATTRDAHAAAALPAGQDQQIATAAHQGGNGPMSHTPSLAAAGATPAAPPMNSGALHSAQGQGQVQPQAGSVAVPGSATTGVAAAGAPQLSLGQQPAQPGAGASSAGAGARIAGQQQQPAGPGAGAPVEQAPKKIKLQIKLKTGAPKT